MTEEEEEDRWAVLSSARKRPDLLNALLDGGLDVNTRHPGDESTLLRLVTQESNIECIRLFLKKNCEINRRDSEGFNALTKYIKYTKPIKKEIVMLLFAAGEQIVKIPRKRSVKTPECLENIDRDINLRAMCRKKIRKHLMDINPHGNLFDRIARLVFPFRSECKSKSKRESETLLLREFLLYKVSLENKHNSKTEKA